MSKPTYEELEAQVKQLAAENAVILQDRAVILEAFDDTCVDIGMRRGEMAEQYPCPVVANTDAIPASLRAEGLEDKAEELYRIANHIASAKGEIPDDWQDWVQEIEEDIRRVSANLRSQFEQVKGVQS